MTTTTTLDVQQIADVYFAAWDARDPDRIAPLHAADTQFQVHTAGSEPAIGRDNVRQTFARVFEQFPGYAYEPHRLLMGGDHWVLDWTLHSDIGQMGCLDVVTLDTEGLVQRKDTYIEPGDLEAVLGRTG